MIPGPSSALLLVLFPAGVIVAALKDATSFTIPNWIPAGLVGAFIPTVFLTHLPWGAVGLCAAAGAAALVFGMGMFAAGWCGGGDAKLLAACALWLGWPGSLTFILATGLAGGLLGLLLIAARKGMFGGYVAAGGPGWLGRLLSPEEDVPYGLAIAAGALIAFPSSALMAAVGQA